MARLNQKRQEELEPKRIESCKRSLENLGYAVVQEGKSLVFSFKGNPITLWPYSGWFSGKGVGSDRGFKKLVDILTR